MGNKRTYYHLILDRSGSMNSCIEQTIGGINQQIKRIKEVAERFPEQEIFTSLTIFNENVTPVWTRLRPVDMRELSFFDYKPSGYTALYDAIGITISELQKSVYFELENNEASVVVVIITDGYENASKKYHFEQIASLIKELEETEEWSFSYLGATLDTIEIAQSLNIKKSNSMRFDVNNSNVIYSKLNESIDKYIDKKQSGKIGKDFLE